MFAYVFVFLYTCLYLQAPQEAYAPMFPREVSKISLYTKIVLNAPYKEISSCFLVSLR